MHRSRDPWLVLAGLCAIGGVVWCALMLVGACTPSNDPIKPNLAAADCLLDRDSEQNKCLRGDAGYTERQMCLDRVRAMKDCTDGGR